MSEYKNCKTYVQLRHESCGHIYDVYSNNFLRGSRCPKCTFSKGEIIIAKWLDKNLIKYVPQYSFDDCIHKSKLKFDFAIFKNDKLNLLIEFDGEQHFRPIKHFGGKQHFEEVQIRDGIKDNYCRDNNIKLLRIPYWEINNTEKILELEII